MVVRKTQRETWLPIMQRKFRRNGCHVRCRQALRPVFGARPWCIPRKQKSISIRGLRQSTIIKREWNWCRQRTHKYLWRTRNGAVCQLEAGGIFYPAQGCLYHWCKKPASGYSDRNGIRNSNMQHLRKDNPGKWQLCESRTDWIQSVVPGYKDNSD